MLVLSILWVSRWLSNPHRDAVHLHGRSLQGWQGRLLACICCLHRLIHWICSTQYQLHMFVLWGPCLTCWQHFHGCSLQG